MQSRKLLGNVGAFVKRLAGKAVEDGRSDRVLLPVRRCPTPGGRDRARRVDIAADQPAPISEIGDFAVTIRAASEHAAGW